MYCGNHAAARKTAARLIRDVGFRPLDMGPLSVARYLEPFTLLVGKIAYASSLGPKVAYRFERFSRRAR